MSAQSDTASESDSSVADMQGQTCTPSSTIKAVIDSLSGVRAHRTVKDLPAAEAEANAGLKGKAKDAVRAMRVYGKKNTSAGRSRGRAQARSSQKSKRIKENFEVRAVVLYVHGVGFDDNGKPFLEAANPQSPIKNEGVLMELEQEGRVKRSVTFNKLFDTDELDNKIRELFPAFFSYVDKLGKRDDGLRHWALCFPERQQLRVCSIPEVTGQNVYDLKGRSDRGKSDSWVHIVSRAPIPDEVLRTWAMRPQPFPLQVSDVESNSGSCKPKKKRAISVSSGSDVDLKSPVKAQKTFHETGSGKNSTILAKLDAALAKVSATATTRPIAKVADSSNAVAGSLGATSGGTSGAAAGPSTRKRTTFKDALMAMTFTNVNTGAAEPLFSRSPTPFSDENSASPDVIVVADTPPLQTGSPTATTPIRKQTTLSPAPQYTPGKYELPSDVSDPWATQPSYQF